MGKLETEMFNTTIFLTTTTTVEQIVVNEDAKSITIAALASMLTASASEPEKKDVFFANSYISSLSDTELAEMEQLLMQKEESMMRQEETPKVYQKEKQC